MSWSALFAAPPADLALRYRTGHRKAPEGETLVVVHGAGVVTRERRRGDERTLVEGRLSAAEVTALFEKLAATGYPDVAAQTVPPGPGIVALEVTGGPADVPVLLHRSFVRDVPALARLVDALDALAARLG